jgi:hypothetical protein
MNRQLVLLFIVFLNAAVSFSCYSQEFSRKSPTDLSRKVAHEVLNQNMPSQVRIGLQGITTLEFPARIEAINGYGFALQSTTDRDEFQLVYEKGTNYFSLKALRPDVSANLSVVLNGKVYCIYCTENQDPSFAVIFRAPGEDRRDSELEVAAFGKKVDSREKLAAFLAKVKAYPGLKTTDPNSINSLTVAEPNKAATMGQIETVIKRVVRDEGLDAIGFEIEINNRSSGDYYFDPDGFAVRVGAEQFTASLSDAGGIVPAGNTVSAYFVVAGANKEVDQPFALEIRTAGAQMANAEATFTPPPDDYVPTGGKGLKDDEGKDSKKEAADKDDSKPKKRTRRVVDQADAAKKHVIKEPDPPPKKPWYSALFKRNPPQ